MIIDMMDLDIFISAYNTPLFSDVFLYNLNVFYVFDNLQHIVGVFLFM